MSEFDSEPVETDEIQGHPVSNPTRFSVLVVLRYAVIGGFLLAATAVVSVAASPSIAERVGTIIPDGWVSVPEVEGHDRGCGCHCSGTSTSAEFECDS